VPRRTLQNARKIIADNEPDNQSSMHYLFYCFADESDDGVQSYQIDRGIQHEQCQIDADVYLFNEKVKIAG